MKTGVTDDCLEVSVNDGPNGPRLMSQILLNAIGKELSQPCFFSSELLTGIREVF